MEIFGLVGTESALTACPCNCAIACTCSDSYSNVVNTNNQISPQNLKIKSFP